MVLASSFAATVFMGPSPIGGQFRSGIWPLAEDPRASAKTEALLLVPPDDSVSAIYYLVPHLAHRKHIYEWPVPWRASNWGVKGENLHDPAGVNWLILDRGLLAADDLNLLEDLLDDEFGVVYEERNIVVARRVKPPPG
jgi:hypothetical protein